MMYKNNRLQLFTFTEPAVRLCEDYIAMHLNDFGENQKSLAKTSPINKVLRI